MMAVLKWLELVSSEVEEFRMEYRMLCRGFVLMGGLD